MVNKKELTEADIRDLYISPSIEKAGWDKFNQIRREVALTPGPIIVRGEMSTRDKRKDYKIRRYKSEVGGLCGWGSEIIQFYERV